MRSKIVGITKGSKIYSALVECIGNEKLVRSALSPGTYPRLMVEDLVKGNRAINGIYQGECDRSKLNYVYIHTRVAEGFEDFVHEYPPTLETVILHEVVHWGRFIAGKVAEIDGKEAGSWFEHLAYGTPYKWHDGITCG